MFINKILNSIKVDVNRLLFLFSITFFIFSSIVALANHSLYIDEVNAWNIAKYVNFLDLFKLMRYEGHLFIWFTILMPFAKNNLFYPYSMQIINWLFCFGAILVMWRFAPFNSYIKSCITLSLPFKIYSQLARCYSLGIFFLFILASLYPKRLEHPIIYAILILVIANTSIMALVGAFAFGVIFLFDLFNSLKNNGISKKLFIFILFFLGAVLVLGQLVNFSIPFYAVNSRFYNFNTNFLCFYLDAPVSIFKIIFATLYSFLLIFSSLFF